MDNLALRLTTMGFDPDAYVQDLSIKAVDVNSLLTTRQKIQSIAEETNGMLKKNVYKNYTQFIETAKEISYLENEMYQLSHMLTEQQAVLNSLLEISIAGSSALNSCERENDSKEDDSGRNLSSLLEQVEGCANILDVQGRTIVHTGELMELNSCDFKQMYQVYVVLLTDALMLATWAQNKRGPVRYRFQALYELDSLSVVNLKEDPSILKNSFKLLIFPDTRIFQCYSPSVKKEWLSLIEQTKKYRASLNRKDSAFSSKNPFATNIYEEEAEDTYEDDAESEIIAQLLELPENLDVCIAQWKFEDAVKLIEEANSHFTTMSKGAALKEIKTRIDNRVAHLVKTLMNELKVSPDHSLQSGPRAARRAVTLLIKLGKTSQACNLFMNHRSAILKQSLRQQKMEGATVSYIERLCSVFFSGMTDTGKEFNRAFAKNNNCASAFVVWAKSQLQQFVQTFSRHVFTTQVAPSVRAQCISVIKTHCNQLTEMGLDLSFLLNNLLENDVKRIITEIRDKLLEVVKLRASEDRWKAQNHQTKAGLQKFLDEMTEIGIASIHTYVFDECWLNLTVNTTSFSKMYLNFVDELLKLHTSVFHGLIDDALVLIFRAQLRHIENSLQNEAFKPATKFIHKNLSFLLDTLLTLAEHHYEEKLGHCCSSLVKLHAELPRLTGSIGLGSKTSFTKYSSTAFL